MIPRYIIQDIESWLNNEKIIILKGARQVGKTTILDKIREKQKDNYADILYFSCDQELNNPIFTDPKLFIAYLRDKYGEDGQKLIILDEFQYIKDAGLFLKVIFDLTKSKNQIIVSGSSSLEVTKNSEYLTGRKVEFYIPTISFREFFVYKSKENIEHYFNDFSKIEDFLNIYGVKLKQSFLEYLNWGGYPEVIKKETQDQKYTIIKEIVSTYIHKDIAGFLKIENIDGYNNLIKVLSSQIGSLVNVSELANTLKLNHETIKKYLNVLEGTYVFDFLKPFFGNLRKELTKMPKVYVNDIGMRNIILNRNPNETYDLFMDGEVIENYVYLVLKNKYGKENLNFYRTVSKSEIDFIVNAKGGLIPLEVKFSEKIFDNLFPAMKTFVHNYSKDIVVNVIITKNCYKFDKEKNVLFLPVYLLEFFGGNYGF